MVKHRLLEDKIKNHFKKYPQALVLLGARQVGKTTLLKRVFPDALYLLVDEKPIYDYLETYSSAVYKSLLGKSNLIIIDEIHLLTNPGRAVKIFYDQIDNLKIIVTGSSSLHIKNKTSESMAGRAIEYYLFPLTYAEYLYQSNIEKSYRQFIYQKIVHLDLTKTVRLYDHKQILENILIYGQYPATIDIPRDRTYLKNLAEKVIFKDILELQLIDNRSKALDLLKLLAYQIGNLISYSEIGSRLELSTATVQKYVEIFEQSYILYRIYPFSKNARDEIGKAPKIYFWDLGLRNALIDNFNGINIRPDGGSMFENFIITEIKKEVSYLDLDYKINYWRLKSGAEVDLILRSKEKFIGCEIKLTGGIISKAFCNRYPEAKTHVITTDNFI